MLSIREMANGYSWLAWWALLTIASWTRNPSHFRFRTWKGRSKQPIRTCYLDHVAGYQPIRDQYFLLHTSLLRVIISGWKLTVSFFMFLPDRLRCCWILKMCPLTPRFRWFTWEQRFRDSGMKLGTNTPKTIGVTINDVKMSFQKPTNYVLNYLRLPALKQWLGVEFLSETFSNQNSLFRSRDWLSANQGPVFPDIQ